MSNSSEVEKVFNINNFWADQSVWLIQLHIYNWPAVKMNMQNSLYLPNCIVKMAAVSNAQFIFCGYPPKQTNKQITTTKNIKQNKQNI